MKRATFCLYFVAVFSLLIYSFSQIDLNLTLSSHPLYQSFQQAMIQLGYFHRPLSTFFFIAIISALFLSYLSLLYLAMSQQLTTQNALVLAVFTALILLLSYPAFSHDIFNYIFDARILVHHHANPYTHTALQFPDDLWTRFMRWTHRTYPYGPGWLGLTAAIYPLGLGKFTLTLLIFKFLGLASYLLSVFSIHRLAHHFRLKHPQFHTLLFAANPLIIIETLVTAHIDAAMAALMLLGVALAFKHKPGSWFGLIFSASIKYISAGLLPFWFLFQKRFLSFNKTMIFSLIGVYLLTLYLVSEREFYPWYLITPFALSSLIKPSRFNLFLTCSLTLASLIRYAPYLYIGDYTPFVITARDSITTLTVITFLILWLGSRVIPISRHE